MQNQKIAQEILDFNKNTVKMSFDALSSFSDQTAKAADQFFSTTPNVPEEGKKAFGIFIRENQKAQTNLKNCVEAGLEIDWTTMEAPVKNLEAMESFYNSAFKQASAIQKETEELLKKTTDQLPKEVKPVVEFWNEAFNSNFQIFQSFVTQNFAVAKKVMANVSAEAPKAAKAASK